MLVFVVFSKHQLVELPSHSQLAVSESSLEKELRSQYPLGYLCAQYFYVSTTPPSPLYLRARVGCTNSPGLWEPFWLRRAVTNRLQYFFWHLHCCLWLCCSGDHGHCGKSFTLKSSPGSGPSGKQRLSRYVNEAAWVMGTLYIITHIFIGCVRVLERGTLLAEILESCSWELVQPKKPKLDFKF